MNTQVSRVRWLALPVALAGALPALSQTSSDVSLTPLVVTANRMEQPITDVLADVTLITREDIERSGASTLADVLSRAPGIEFVRNGGPGTTTSLYLRGGDTRFTALLIDGMRVDSQSTGGASWNAIPCAQIDRIEIVRGAASSVYGSDAVTGVIQVFTRKGQQGLFPAVEAGIGTRGTRKLGASVAGGNGTVDYFLGLEQQSSDGFNVMSNPANSAYVPDQDGYRHKSVSAGLGVQVDKQHRIEANLLWADLDAQYDASRSRAQNDDHSLLRAQVASLRWMADFTPQWRSILALGDSVDRYETRPSPYRTRTHLSSLAWQNEYRMGLHGLQFGLERKQDRLLNSDTGPGTRHRAQNSVSGAYTLREAEHHLQANLRHDQDSEFGGQTTGGLAYAYQLNANWKVTAGAGTSFRAPTLYHRFSQYGQAGLKPEEGLNREVGVVYEEAGLRASAVAYRNTIDNLITYSTPGVCASTFGCYRNTAHAVLSGVTLAAVGKTGSVRWNGSLDLQDPRDADLDRRLRRRSAAQLKLGAVMPLWGGEWGVDAQWTGQRYENAANTQVLGAYTLIAVDARYKLSKEWTLLARLDNLTNAKYELAKDFATPGRSLYVGLKWAPQ